MKNFISIAILFFAIQGQGLAQPAATKDDVEDIKLEITKMNEKFEKLTNKTIQFGLSIGYRELVQKDSSNYEEASISPIDSTLQLSRADDGGFLLSTSVIFNPKLNTKLISNQILAQIYSYILDQNEKNDTISNLNQSSRLLFWM
ncbi:MAG: hypothetical protein IPJ40_04365 [Saprospirales bacterium]|nr:hypothetical protein [Saprospirales bacterium]